MQKNNRTRATEDLSSSEFKVLYITYDGVLDPLGQSQILPYLESIGSKLGGALLLSFEKSERYLKLGGKLNDVLKQGKIRWFPIRFTHGSRAIYKTWDFGRMIFLTLWLTFKYRVKVVHARGHLGAITGLLAKFVFGTKLIFDFRGLWVDERVDKGGWNLGKHTHRYQYNIFKHLERITLRYADHVIVLTKAVVTEVRQIGKIKPENLTVIPCCADFELYQLATNDRRSAARARFGFNESSTVIGYLGSVGEMYLVERFLLFARHFEKLNSNLQILVLTPDIDLFSAKLKEYQDTEFVRKFIFYSATREEVAEFAPAFNVLVSFIKPSYARKASSPTKIAEILAMGIPVVTNHGIGDLSEIIPNLDGGIVIDVGIDAEIKTCAFKVSQWNKSANTSLRSKARLTLGLEIADRDYQDVYKKIGVF